MSPARLDHSRSRARASYLAALPSTRSLPGFACSGPCRGASGLHGPSLANAFGVHGRSDEANRL